MKIIQIIPFFGMGGAENMCETLCYELQKLGHSVIAVSLYTEKTVITERLENHGVELRFLDKKHGLDLSLFKKIKILLEQEKPDVVHTHLYSAKYVFLVAAKLKIRAVHTVHNIASKEASGISAKFNRFFFKRGKAIPVALSEQVRNTITEQYGLPPENVPTVLNGVDLSKCIKKNDYSVDGKFKIVNVARFSEQKNHKGLLEAFLVFHKNHRDSELWLVGDGEKRAEIESFVKENGLENAVVFCGVQSNVYGYLHDADIFTLPSNYEGVPMTLIEAMGTGLPIVATAVGGVPDMLDEESALLVPVETSAIADAFEKYYLDYELRKFNGENALKAAKRFSAETMARKYINIYQRKEACHD